VTLTGLTYGYLISGAVLIETVFAWGGLGQFAIQSIISSDYFAVTGTVMAVAIFALAVYVVMDILYALIDPRIKY
jgi:peptide/nickel transport system permease protein